MLPTITNYGRYPSDNYGAHTRTVSLAQIDLYYSYNTIVAYCDKKDGLTVSVNIWGATTGKHLNWIDGGNKKARLPNDAFNVALRAAA